MTIMCVCVCVVWPLFLLHRSHKPGWAGGSGRPHGRPVLHRTGAQHHRQAFVLLLLFLFFLFFLLFLLRSPHRPEVSPAGRTRAFCQCPPRRREQWWKRVQQQPRLASRYSASGWRPEPTDALQLLSGRHHSPAGAGLTQHGRSRPSDLRVFHEHLSAEARGLVGRSQRPGGALRQPLISLQRQLRLRL